MTKKIKNISKSIAMARIKTLPDDIIVHLSGRPSLSKAQMLQNIVNDTDIGQELVEIQLDFIRDIASGKIYQDD
jgi:hypothetical protein